MNKSKGFGLMDIVFFGLLVGFGVFLLFKIGFPFYENNAFKRIVNENSRLALTDNVSEKEMISKIKNGLAIENIKNIPIEDAEITMDSNSVHFKLDYSIETPLYGNNVYIKTYFEVDNEVGK